MPLSISLRSGRSRSWSLRAQLIVALVMAVALFGATASLLTARAYRQDRAAAGRQLLKLAHGAAARLDEQTAQSEQLLAGIAAQDAIAGLDASGCGLVLSGFRGLAPGYLVLLRADGRALCSSRPTADLPLFDSFMGAIWLSDAVRRGAPIHAEPISDPVTKQPSMVIAAPVPAVGGRAPAAVLAAVLDLDAFAPDLVGPLEQDRGTVVAAADAAGTHLLFRHPGHYAGRVLTGNQRGSSLFEAKGFDGVARVYRAVTAPQLGWRVIAGTPVSVAFAPARRAVGQSILLTIVVFAVLALLALLLSRRVLRPARALTNAIVAAQSSPEAGAAPQDGPAELARMAAEFNALLAARAEDRAQLQQALVRFTEVQEDERRRIAQSVHDETIQALIATMWALDDLDFEEISGRSGEIVERVRGNLAGAVAAARTLLFELRPPALDELGLSAAIEQQLERLGAEDGIKVAFESNLDGRLPAHVETLAFRTTQEALRNVHLHASATNARVTVLRSPDHIEIAVEDDGIGVRSTDIVTGEHARAGIVAMRETITMYGGTFAIGPRAAGGTRVSFSLPA